MFDTPSGRVRIESIRDGTPAKTCEGLAVGDVLLAVNGVRAVDVETAVAVLRMVEGTVTLRTLRYGGDLEIVTLTKVRGHRLRALRRASHRIASPSPPRLR